MGNFVWETLQLPLYTLWRSESAPSIARAVLHCTAGDIAITSVAVVAALATVGNPRWPRERWAAVAIAVVAIGVSYAIWSEYQNTVIRGSWSYTEQMPILPWIGTGLAPLTQWIAVPVLAFIVARGARAAN